MRNQLVSFLGFCLFLFCVIVVIWQVWQGTRKYLAAPVASKIYNEEAELPVITICHNDQNRMIANIHKLVSYNQFVKEGKFMPKEPLNMTAQEIFDEALSHYYHILDSSGLLSYQQQ